MQKDDFRNSPSKSKNAPKGMCLTTGSSFGISAYLDLYCDYAYNDTSCTKRSQITSWKAKNTIWAWISGPTLSAFASRIKTTASSRKEPFVMDWTTRNIPQRSISGEHGSLTRPRRQRKEGRIVPPGEGFNEEGCVSCFCRRSSIPKWTRS